MRYKRIHKTRSSSPRHSVSRFSMGPLFFVLALLFAFSSMGYAQADAIAIVKTGTLDDSNGNGCGDAGESITYAFTVTNTGNTPLTEVTVSDPMLEALNPIVPITFTGGDTNNDQALGPDETWGYTANYVLTQPDVDAGFVENQATVTANTCSQSSTLWGEHGELWDPANSPLRDFSNVGYRSGDVPIPDWPIGVSVLDYGAIPNDGLDDSQAFLDAIAACPDSHAVFVPNGKYKLLQQLRVERENFVLRGEDMYETVLWCPEYLTELYPEDHYNDSYTTSFFYVRPDNGTYAQIGIEQLSFEFRDQIKGNHWEFRGNDAIEYANGVQDSWIRNIYIKNADHAITISGNNTTRVSVINIKLDQYITRPDISPNIGDWVFGWVGHVGIGLADCSYILIHEVEFTGRWFHDFDILSPNHSVLSRVRGSDFSYNRHSQGGQFNLYTEGNSGRGSRTISGDLTPSNETYWNIVAERDITDRYTDPDQSTGNVFVAVPTSEPELLTDTFWIEHIDPALLCAPNIYLAQLAYFGKPLPEPPPPPIPDTPDPNVLMVNPVEDNTVSFGYQGSDANTVSNWTDESLPLSGTSFLKFDLRALNLTGVTRARLKVNAKQIQNTPFTVALMSVEDDSWSEETLTYNNQPPAITELASREFTEDGHGRWYEMDVTNFVQSQIAGDKIITLKLTKTDGTGTNSRIYSRDLGRAPLLIIEQAAALPTPAAPANLQTTPGEGFIGLDWDAPVDSANITYTVYRREAGEPYGYPIATGLADSYFNDVDYFVENKESSDLPSGITFYYIVTAVNKAFKESAPSAEQTGSSIDTTPPDPPKRLAANPGDQAVNLNWAQSDAADFSSYNIYRSQAPGSYDFAMPLVSGLANSSYADMSVVNEVTYYYVVEEVDLAGNLSGPGLENSATPSAHIVALYNFNNSSSASFSSHPYTTSSDLTEGGGLGTDYETRSFGIRGNPIPSLRWPRDNINESTVLDDDYLSFSVTADDGSLDFNRLQMDVKGSADIYLFSDQTGFTALSDTLAQVSSSGSEFTRFVIPLTDMSTSLALETTEFRLYFSASSHLGDVHVDNIILYAESVGTTGTASPEGQPGFLSMPNDGLVKPIRIRTPFLKPVFAPAVPPGHTHGTDRPSYPGIPTNTSPNASPQYARKDQPESSKTTQKAAPAEPSAVQTSTASDLSGTAPDNDTPTRTELCTLPVFIEQISLSLLPVGGTAYQGQTVVLVYDGNGNPVPNAGVTGTFSGAFNELLVTNTDTNGEATFVTTGSLSTPCFDFSFCVNDVNHATMDYESSLNTMSCESINSCLCQDTDIMLDADLVTQDSQHWAEHTLLSSQALPAGSTTSYQAGTSVTLQPGFHARPGAAFSAVIAECIEPQAAIPQFSQSGQPVPVTSMARSGQAGLRVFPNPFRSKVQTEMYLPEPGDAFMYIMDISGRRIHQLADGHYDAGLYRLSWAPGQLTTGVYWVQLIYKGQVATRKVVRLR